MNQEELKQAAEEYSKKVHKNELFKNFINYTKDDFIAGAQWQAERDKWISVEDRYPSEGEEVNVYFEYEFKGREKEVGVTSAIYETQETLRPCFYQVNGSVVIGVRKWQPLPEPPKTK